MKFRDYLSYCSVDMPIELLSGGVELDMELDGPGSRRYALTDAGEEEFEDLLDADCERGHYGDLPVLDFESVDEDLLERFVTATSNRDSDEYAYLFTNRSVFR